MNASPNIFYYYYFNLPLFVIQFIQNSLFLKFGCYIELVVDARDYRGFAMILYGVLDSLGVPTERITCMCRGEAGPDGLLQGHVVVHLWVPTSAYVPVLHAFEEVAVETSVAASM
jgi:hypothetical protein